jgi:hypothetical protein
MFMYTKNELICKYICTYICICRYMYPFICVNISMKLTFITHVLYYTCIILQANSIITHREAIITDNLERINISTNLKSFFQNHKTENKTENIKNLKCLSENCDFYNHRGYILKIHNEDNNGSYVIWEFHLPSMEIRNSW